MQNFCISKKSRSLFSQRTGIFILSFLSTIQDILLQTQQLFLDPQSAAVTDHSAVCTDDSMTGHNDGQPDCGCLPSRPHDKLSDFLPALQPAHSSSSLHREWFAAPSRPAFESRSPAISVELKSWCGCPQNILSAAARSAAANLYRPHTGPMGPGQNASRSDSRLLLPSADAYRRIEAVSVEHSINPPFFPAESASPSYQRGA